MSTDPDPASVRAAFWAAFAFVYRKALAVAAVSLAWTVASLPLVTVGPATLGAYAAIRSLREDGEVDTGAVLRTVRRQGLNAALLGGAVVLVGATSLLYLGQYVRTSSTVTGALGVTGLYVAIHLALVLMPTFVGLARGVSMLDALKTSYRWSVERPAAAVSTLAFTALLLVVSLVLTVALVLVFPAVAAWFHTASLSPLYEPEPELAPGGEERPASADYAGPGDG